MTGAARRRTALTSVMVFAVVGCSQDRGLDPAEAGCSASTAITVVPRAPWTSCETTSEWTIAWSQDQWCYQGYGFLKPVGADPGAEAIRARLQERGVPSSDVTVTRRSDGWYELCFTT